MQADIAHAESATNAIVEACQIARNLICWSEEVNTSLASLLCHGATSGTTAAVTWSL